MQSATWGNVVDEEQDIRNDGSKSSRSHRAFKFSNQLFLASTNARHFPRFYAQTHVRASFQLPVQTASRFSSLPY
jgi:hypothetical protein